MAIESFVVDSNADDSGCATSAVYPIGTTLVVVGRVESVRTEPAAQARVWLPGGTELRTVGHYTEAGTCDLWPVEVVKLPLWHVTDWAIPVGAVGLVDERTVRPVEP